MLASHPLLSSRNAKGALLLLATAGPLLAACSDRNTAQGRAGEQTLHPQAPAGAGGPLRAAAPAAASPADDGQWTMPTKDYANTRFSALTEINRGNAGQLRLAFSLPVGTSAGQESAPLAVGGTLYFVSSWPNILSAVDLADPAHRVKWTVDPRTAAEAQGRVCCEGVNRGPTYANGTLYFGTTDTQVLAVDAASGRVKWKVRLGDYRKGDAITGAPFVVGDKVFIGNSGAEFGARGWLTALNAADGSIAWRAWATGSDKDVLIDPARFRPFYPQYRGKDLGMKSWPPDAWQIGGGTSWGFMSYDPEQNLIFYGTSNPAPWNHEVRPGDNLWTNGVFARDPQTGLARWYYQYSPHDLWDHSGINENILLDLVWQGRPRKVMVRPERNGFVYVLDRTTGQVLAADPYVAQNAALGVDLKTGRLINNPEKVPTQGKVMRGVCPNSPGAKDWSPSAFGKTTGLLYVPHNNLCMDWLMKKANYIAGTPYIGVVTRFFPGPGGNAGEFMAWDPARRRKAWAIAEKWPVWSGAAATAGGLVFYGTLDGWFKAVDAESGKLLWRYRTRSGIIGQPTVWRGPDGHQYVSVLSGIGGWVGSMVSKNLDPRDPTAQKGFANMTGALKRESGKGGMLYVFSLPH